MHSGMTRSDFLKKCIFANPYVTLEEVLDLWKKANDPSIERPDFDSLRNQKYNLHVKYGLNSITDFPLKLDGKPNMTELIRSMRKKNPSITEKEVIATFTRDGLSFSESLVRGVFRENMKTSVAFSVKKVCKDKRERKNIRNEESPSTSIEEGQVNCLPKNGSPSTSIEEGQVNCLPKNGSSPIKTEEDSGDGKVADMNVSNMYGRIEDEIDNLLAKAREIMDSELINTLKTARRHVIIRAEKCKGKKSILNI